MVILLAKKKRKSFARCTAPAEHRRSKVPETDFKAYLMETYGITEVKELQQRNLPRVLEWPALRQARRRVTDVQPVQQESD